ncbi:MAG: JDVT-CTERM domain-containing protein [Deltaproteobacteria bacterium]|nr:JDVT-CTERM domain-containing protein [Deltaproteobacteria bacterium]
MKKWIITCTCLIFLMGVFFPKILFSFPSLGAVGADHSDGGGATKSGSCSDGSFVDKINVSRTSYTLPPPDSFHCQGNGISEDIALLASGGISWIKCPENYVATGWKIGEDGGITGIILVCTRFSGDILYDDNTKEDGIYAVIPSDDQAQAKFLRGEIPSTFRTCPTQEALTQISVGYDISHQGNYLTRISGECHPFPGGASQPVTPPQKIKLTLKNEFEEGDCIQSDAHTSDPCRTECPEGMIIKGLNVRSGSLVDNIGVICVNINNPSLVDYGPTKCGGEGGATYTALCHDGEYVKGFKVRVGEVWEGIQLKCAKINYYAQTLQDVFSGENYFQDLEYGVNMPSREDHNYPDPPATSYWPLCSNGTSFPVRLDVWHNRFCWKSRGLIYDTTVCYDDIVRGAKTYCKEAFIGEETQTAIDLSGFFHRNDEVQQVEFIGTAMADFQDNSETPSEDTSENSATPSARECTGQCSEVIACPSGQIMNFCCNCDDLETAPPNNGGGNDRGNVGPVGHSNQPDPSAGPNTDSAPKSNFSKGGGGCSLNNNASFDPSLAVLFPISLFLLILRRRRLVYL